MNNTTSDIKPGQLKRVLRKWNYKKHKYEPYMIPINWNCKTFSEDMDEIVNCAQCGIKTSFGNTYTSHEIHTGSGIGYCVCSTCYEKERERKI